MAFLQLHYTSCEQGLSGYAGFQFCAVSQGVSPVMMREVERQTIYEPPSIGLASGRRTPVNLLYTYDEGMDAVIIARIEFVGLDFSNRLGNYFAHALISTTPADLQSMLPVELWDAQFWQSSQGADSVLPPLASPPPSGPVTRLTVADFLACGGYTAERLAVLATLADHAMNSGRQLLVIGEDTGEICRWIAAATYLLAPGSARRLTFSTYSYDPIRCSAHVVGTVPGTRTLHRGRTAGFHVVDLGTGELPAIPPSPAAALLARLGVVRAAEVWHLAGSLGAAPELALGDAIAVLASAALMLGEQLTPDEADIAIEWFTTAADERVTGEHLAAAVSSSLSQPLTGLSALRKRQLVALARRAAGADSLTSQLEATIVAGAMDAADKGRSPGAGIPLLDPAASQAAIEGCRDRLATSDAVQALDLLVWASASGATPAGEVIRHVGRDAIVAGLLNMTEMPGLTAIADALPDLRVGMAEGIAALPNTDRQRLIAGTAAGHFQLEDFANYPELGEEWVMARARAGALPPVTALARIMAFRRTWQDDPVADERLIGRIWSGNEWTLAEAVTVAGLPPGEIRDEAVISRVAALLDSVPQTTDDSWINLVDTLAALPPGTLPQPVTDRATELARLIQIPQTAVQRGQPEAAIEVLLRRYRSGSSVADAFIRVQLSLLLTRRRRLGVVLGGWPHELFVLFCEYLREEGAHGRLSMPVLASLFVAMEDLEARCFQYAYLLSDHVLAPLLQGWSKPEIAALGVEADRIAQKASAYIDVWFLRNSPGRRFRLPHIRRRDP